MLAFWARSLQDKTFLPVTSVSLLTQRLETYSDETSALAAPRPPLQCAWRGSVRAGSDPACLRALLGCALWKLWDYSQISVSTVILKEICLCFVEQIQETDVFQPRSLIVLNHLSCQVFVSIFFFFFFLISVVAKGTYNGVCRDKMEQSHCYK